MLHEILLSLSGYPSPIWKDLKEGEDVLRDGFIDYISVPERSMLEVLAHLSEVHLQVKDIASTISTHHSSMVCRAVAGEIQSTHLASFRKRVIEVEKSILSKDSAYVGGYEIIPLSTVVGDFDPWTRRLEWLLHVANAMHRPRAQGNDAPAECTGAKIIDFLERETYTGYVDIEQMAVSLYTAAQAAWLRQAASWLLYGRLPSVGGVDFFIQPQGEQLGQSMDSASISRGLIPAFVSLEAAESILSIGTSVNHIRAQSQAVSLSPAATVADPVAKLLPLHLGYLNSLTYPLSSSVLASTISVIKSSISQNALSELLSFSVFNLIMRVIHDYLLLNEGEFAVALIAQADAWIASRNSTQNALRPIRKAGRVDELAVQQAELGAILNQTWEDLAASSTDSDMLTDSLDYARQMLRLQLAEVDERSHLISTVLPVPSKLTMHLPPESGFSLFLSSADLQTYSTITSYLLSIRRAELHLSELWKLTPLRRCHPTPVGPTVSAMSSGIGQVAVQRARTDARNVSIRKHWASAGKALFVLNEIGSYLHGEVISKHWEALRTWVDTRGAKRPSSAGSRPGTTGSVQSVLRTSQQSEMASTNDPAVLADAHRTCLRTMKTELFLDNKPFVHALRDLLVTCDHFIALYMRLQGAWQGLDLQEDERVVDTMTNFKKDESEVWWEMERNRKLLEERITRLVQFINDFGNVDRGIGIDERMRDLDLDRAHHFVPFHDRTIDRLIMKLEFLAGRRQGPGAENMYNGDG